MLDSRTASQSLLASLPICPACWGRPPQPLQSMRFRRMDVSRVWIRWFGSIHHQSGQKENLLSVGVPCHMSHFCCDSSRGTPLLPAWREAGLMQGTLQPVPLCQPILHLAQEPSNRPYLPTFRHFPEICVFKNPVFTG